MAGDTNIDIVKIRNIPQIFKSFSYAADNVNNIAPKIAPLLQNITPKFAPFVEQLPKPVNAMEPVPNAEIRGHMMTTKTILPIL